MLPSTTRFTFQRLSSALRKQGHDTVSDRFRFLLMLYRRHVTYERTTHDTRVETRAKKILFTDRSRPRGLQALQSSRLRILKLVTLQTRADYMQMLTGDAMNSKEC